MLCALTVRKLKPGSFDAFREKFMDEEEPPPGAVRFNMIRNRQDPDEVVCFGFFDGTEDEMRRAMAESGYDKQYEAQLEAIAPFVESVGTDAIFDVVEDETY
ncbi:MAG: hypothetical protein ACM3QU_07075 [Verrucomicrobiota bacterium]